jgi:hypothetical protein
VNASARNAEYERLKARFEGGGAGKGDNATPL